MFIGEYTEFVGQFEKIFSRNPQLSNIKPSEWAEKNIIIPGNKGKLNYDFNPYCREIIDTLAPDHPARKVAVMKGSQITFSSGVIYPALGFIIAEDPHNTYLIVGTEDLVKLAGEKMDFMIQGAQLQDYISYQMARKKNNKSGDTDQIKSFPNGYIKLGAATNFKSIAQVDLGRIFLDDFDAMKGKDKTAGSLEDLIEMRAASNKNTYKLIMISTPLTKIDSNIEPAFLAGDQRRYFVNCECCHEQILIKWSVKAGEIINPLTGEKAVGDGGIMPTIETNNHNQLIKKKIGYICYLCSGYFTDRNKQQMLREALWKPTAIPVSDDYYSYHLSSLYAPVGMFDWAYYAGKYVKANPIGQPRDEAAMKVIINTCWGETYSPPADSPEANQIQKNVRDYAIGTVPEKLSIEDGNGRIILLTCAADMNGKAAGYHKAKEDDARLDYEILAWSESGATYSISHGSIGTFIPREGQKDEKDKVDREKWSYDKDVPNSVWPEFEKILGQSFLTDTGREMKIMITGLDCGFLATTHAYPFLDGTNYWVIGLKGSKDDDEGKYILNDANKALFKAALEKANVYIPEVGFIKDKLSGFMQLKWNGTGPQPDNFMNYPTPSDGLYTFTNFFEHYQAEHRNVVTNKDGNSRFRWEKKNSSVQNHLWDCRVYNIAVRDIFLHLLAKELGLKGLTWKEYVAMINN